MKTRKAMLSATLIAAMGLSTAGLQAQQNRPDANRPDVGRDTDRQGIRATANLGEDSAKVGKFHKASKLIGMNIKNQQNEELGEVQELVVDLSNGRISYVVMGVGGILGIGEKYIAVPPSAFNQGPEGEQLVLNANKSKIEQAPGFTKDNWPDVENPAWGAYWGARATGLPDQQDQLQNQQDQFRQNQLQNRQGQEQFRNQQQQQGELQTRPLRTQPGQGGQLDRQGQVGQQQAGQNMFSGEIISVNPQSRTMTVKGDLGTQVFVIDQTATVRLKDVPTGKLSDLKVGDKVNVNFRKQADGAGVAYTIQSADEQQNQQRQR